MEIGLAFPILLLLPHSTRQAPNFYYPISSSTTQIRVRASQKFIYPILAKSQLKNAIGKVLSDAAFIPSFVSLFKTILNKLI